MRKSLLCSCFAIFLMDSAAYSQANPNREDQNQPIENLRTDLARLEAQLNMAEKKLPFGEMALLTIVSGENNMNKVTNPDGSTYFKNEVKIDNPVCNNNPKAIILATSHTLTNDILSVNVYFDKNDGYWYIKTPDWLYKGFEPGIIINTAATTPGGLFLKEEPEFKRLSDTRFENTYGIGYAGGRYAIVGMKFSVLIFKEQVVPMTQIQSEEPAGITSQVPQTDSTKTMNGQFFPLTGEWLYKMISSDGVVYKVKV